MLKDDGSPGMGRSMRVALRIVQAALLAFAGYQLFRANQTDNAIHAFAWSIPWLIFALISLVVLPTLVRLGWRRFGRRTPTWTVAMIISTTAWAVATMLCWMGLGIVLILSD